MRDPGSLEAIRAYYDRILPFYEKETTKENLSLWRGLARRWRPGKILEVGSGLGAVTQALAREAPAYGLDISLSMLRLASRRGGSRARFVAADMRRIVFACCFDLIVAPSDAFCHWTRSSDRRKALANVAALLSPGGRFVLEALYRPGRKVLRLERRIRYGGGELEIEETWRPAGARGLWDATYRYRDRRPGAREGTLEASFRARAWSVAEIRQLFAECGLTVERLWGDLRRRRFRSGDRRLVVVARRAHFVHRGE